MKKLLESDSKDGPIRKYATEFALNMVGNPVALVQQQDLIQNPSQTLVSRLKEEPCHIYMICRRPRISIDPQSFIVDETSIRLDFIVQIKDRFLSFPSVKSNGFGKTDLHLKTDYPFTSFTIGDSERDARLRAKAALFAGKFGVADIAEHLNLEILYVGQSYGTEGSRSAQDRLGSHSTLQSIYAEAVAESPDKEIWLILWSFSPMLISSIDGRWNSYETTTEQDDSHAEKVTVDSITEQQRINFTEAALIRYFQPPFNLTYKNKFPSPAHATYSECYEFDLNSVLVELNTEDIFAKIFSDAVAPKWHHTVNFNLHSAEERRSMFSVLIPDSHTK